MEIVVKGIGPLRRAAGNRPLTHCVMSSKNFQCSSPSCLLMKANLLSFLKSYNSISQTIVVPKSQRDFHILTQLLDLSLVELFSILFHSPHIHSYESSLCSPLIVTCFWKIFRYRKCYVETCRTQ